MHENMTGLGAGEKRILHDAALVRDGARVAETGRLAITAEQYMKAKHTGDPLAADVFSGLTRAELNYRLDIPIDEAWPQTPLLNNVRICNQLERGGIASVRDLFVVGQIGATYVPNIGEKSRRQIEQFLSHTVPGLSWLSRPSAKDIALICERLDQVSAHTLASFYPTLQRGVTIHDVLVTPEPELPELFRTISYLQAEGEAAQIRADAELFAAEFAKYRPASAGLAGNRRTTR